MSNNLSFEQLAEELEKMGITGISKERINSLDENWNKIPEDMQTDKMPILLSAIGSGEYNYSTNEWKPTSKQIYSFDMECINSEEMYTLLLNGISNITDGEIEITNIKEDTSQVDFYNGTGIQKITFDLNGKPNLFEAKVDYDWYDLRILNYLNSILKSENNTKELYFMGDGYQECIVFYCSKEWADLFEEKTGYKLINNINISYN